MAVHAVHHLNCGSMREIEADDRPTPAAALCHCLLVETDEGLLLVDTGMGLGDVREPQASLGSDFLGRAEPALRKEETAVRQLARLGYDPVDVTHIVLTHLDLDHSGGLPDFPGAAVHLHRAELDAAIRDFGAHSEDRIRYRPLHWEHGPRWETHEKFEPGSWFDFAATSVVDGVHLVPLPGHTAGHCGVAVHSASGWILHAGDAYYFHGETDPQTPRPHPMMEMLAQLTQVDASARLDTVAHLGALRRAHGHEVTVVSAHDPWEFDTACGRA